MYFLIKNPYYSLIKARDLDHAVELYQEVVSDAWTKDELEELYYEMNKISIFRAIRTFISDTMKNDNLSFFEAIRYFFTCEKYEVLLVDISLL